MARAQSSGSGTWMDHLPFVLLGLRTAVRADSDCSPADLVYGEHLRIPAALLDSSTTLPAADPSSFVSGLRDTMQQNAPMPFNYHGTPPSRVPSALRDCSHVFLRVDAVRRPLSPPYEGPFLVLERGPKTFILDRLGKRVTVTVDRLKPASVLQPVLDPSPAVRPSLAAQDPVPPSRLDPQEWPLPT